MVETAPPGSIRRFQRVVGVLLVLIVAATASFLLSHPKGATAKSMASGQTNETGLLARIDTEWAQRAAAKAATIVVDSSVKAPTPSAVGSTHVATAPASGPAVAVAVPAIVTQPSVTELVTQVEATGIVPGSNWTWSMGDTATHCGLLTGAGTGCTYGSGGLEFTIFTGSPTLALVAHELANAETQNDAVPNLLGQVSLAEAGTSWSPTDAVASCLVEHFMGFQDDAAGSWQCPAALATVVADTIHDTL
jgi:hypothetical protein